MNPRHVVVIGGGIAGVAAAARLRELGGPLLRITVVEQARRLGGKIHTGQLAGVAVETGAETFLVRRPEALALARSVGLGPRLVHPSGAPAALVVGDVLHDLPRRTVMGVPARASDVAEVLSPSGLDRLRRAAETGAAETPLLGDQDVSVGALVREHFGDEVVDRLVDPLLGGVYSGRADDLSVEVTLPQLAAAARRHTTLAEAVASCLPPAAPKAGNGSGSVRGGRDEADGVPLATGGAVASPAQAPGRGATATAAAPVFGSVEGGLSRLVEAVAAASGAEIVLGEPVRELRRTPTGWRLVAGDTRTPRLVDADAVVLAVPARPAARLLRDVDAGASAEIGVLDYASIALAGFAFEGVELPRRSGFLVPATEGRTIKAATFFSRKWPQPARPGLGLVRVSMGRYGEEQVLQREDGELLAIARRELSRILGTALPEPVEAKVDRWGGGLPQYRPGHAGRVRRARAALEGQPIAVAGAVADGVGIPACVASGRDAAETVLARIDTAGRRPTLDLRSKGSGRRVRSVVAGGRGQGQRAGLTRQAVLDAALRLADREGLTALSMRRLGAELGVEAMTLYHHVPNKDALLDGLVEQVVAAARPPRFGTAAWDVVLRDHARALLDTLLAHPAVVPLVVTRPATTPANLRTVEATLSALVAAGFTPRQALDVTYSLTGFVVGQAAALAGTGHDDTQRAQGQLRRLSDLDAAEYPLLAEAAGTNGPAAARSRFEFALDAMLAGFAAALSAES